MSRLSEITERLEQITRDLEDPETDDDPENLGSEIVA